ncbi:MAG: hypothetical protein V4603_07310 [Pseudomonadota bacterium]
MRNVSVSELEEVSGGEWTVTLHLGIADVELSGPETAQEIYGGAVDAMADFFTWWDPVGFYSACGGGGGR